MASEDYASEYADLDVVGADDKLAKILNRLNTVNQTLKAGFVFVKSEQGGSGSPSRSGASTQFGKNISFRSAVKPL